MEKNMTELLNKIFENGNEVVKSNLCRLRVILEDSEKNTKAAEASHFVMCVKRTSKVDGRIDYNPVVSTINGMPSTNPEDLVMIGDTSLVKAQRNPTFIRMKNQMEASENEVVFVPVKEADYQELCTRLKSLVEKVYALIDEAINPIGEAYALLHRGKSMENTMIKLKAVEMVFDKVVTCGSACSEDGEVCDVPEEGYVEDDKPENNDDDDDDNDDDNDDDDDDDDDDYYYDGEDEDEEDEEEEDEEDDDDDDGDDCGDGYTEGYDDGYKDYSKGSISTDKALRDLLISLNHDESYIESYIEGYNDAVDSAKYNAVD